MKAQDKTKRSELIFDARKNFFELKIVKLTFALLAVLSVSTAVVIVCNSKITADWSFSGFNNFLDIFKVPIGILALNIPIIAILGAFHKSEQTRLQIKLSDGQNLFANYFKHIEEFVKYIEKFDGFNENFRCDARRLHYKLYPNAAAGDYDLSDKAALKVADLIDYYQKINASFKFNKNDDIHKALDKHCNSLHSDIRILSYEIFHVELKTNYSWPSPTDCYDSKLLRIAFYIEYIFNYYNFIRYVISFNYSAKIEKERYNILNSISVRNYKTTFEQFFEKNGNCYRVSREYSNVNLVEIYEIFLFLFLGALGADSTR